METVNIQDGAVIELINQASPNVESAYSFFQKKVNFGIPKNNYTAIWYALSGNSNLNKALELVFEYILTKANKGDKNVFNQATKSNKVNLTDDNSHFINELFFQKGTPKKLGALFISYYTNREQTDNPISNGSLKSKTKNNTPKASKEVKKIVQQSSGEEKVSTISRGLQLEKVKFGYGKYLTFKLGCSELEIENYFVDNWSQINFGFDEPLIFVKRQIRPRNDSAERIDILAKTPSGKLFVIEIKARQANGNAISQLQSYMNYIEHEFNLPAELITGLLIAPSYSDKVITGLQKTQRIELLQFYIQE